VRKDVILKIEEMDMDANIKRIGVVEKRLREL
jgi:hypothetical protein